MPGIAPVADPDAALILAPARAPTIMADSSLHPDHVARAIKEFNTRNLIRVDIPGTRVGDHEVTVSQVRLDAVLAQHADNQYPGSGQPDWFHGALTSILMPNSTHFKRVRTTGSRRLMKNSRRLMDV